MQIFLLRPTSALKLRKGNITGTRFKEQAGCRRNRGFMCCIGSSLLCVTAVSVVCSSEIYCAECYSWVLHGIRAKVYGMFIGRYFTAGGQCYCSLNGLCYSEHYVEDTSQQVDSGIEAWMERVTVNVMWKILHSRWTVILKLEWNVLHWTLCGRYFTAGGQWYCSLNEVCYSEHYLEDTSQQIDTGIAAWMKFVTVNTIYKILHSRWTVVLQLEWSMLQWILSEGISSLIKANGYAMCSIFTLLIHSITNWHQVVSLGNTQQMSVNETLLYGKDVFLHSGW
jgi:hypothetical protein